MKRRRRRREDKKTTQTNQATKTTTKWKVERTRLGFDCDFDSIRFDFEPDGNSIMITGHPAGSPLYPPPCAASVQPLAAVASLAKNGNVYMRVAQCHNVACLPLPLSPFCQCPCMCWQHFLRAVNYMSSLARDGQQRGSYSVQSLQSLRALSTSASTSTSTSTLSRLVVSAWSLLPGSSDLSPVVKQLTAAATQHR